MDKETTWKMKEDWLWRAKEKELWKRAAIEQMDGTKNAILFPVRESEEGLRRLRRAA
jgi:hypothetical protein